MHTLMSYSRDHKLETLAAIVPMSSAFVAHSNRITMYDVCMAYTICRQMHNRMLTYFSRTMQRV